MSFSHFGWSILAIALASMCIRLVLDKKKHLEKTIFAQAKIANRKPVFMKFKVE